MPERIQRRSSAAPAPLTKRPIGHAEAKDVAQRLIAGAFNRDDNRPRFSIPTRVDYDDDCLILAYIEQREAEAAEHDRREIVRQRAAEDEAKKVELMAEGAAAERAAIVKWLREHAREHVPPSRNALVILLAFARDIERGEHEDKPDAL